MRRCLLFTIGRNLKISFVRKAALSRKRWTNRRATVGSSVLFCRQARSCQPSNIYGLIFSTDLSCTVQERFCSNGVIRSTLFACEIKNHILVFIVNLNLSGCKVPFLRPFPFRIFQSISLKTGAWILLSGCCTLL